MSATLHHGNVTEWARAYTGPKFHAVMCDPPYELGFMGRKWDSSGVAFSADTWSAIASVCKPGAMLLAFGGTRTFHRIAVAIEDAGWEIRDTVMWLYGQGFPKSHDVSKAIDREAGAQREVVGYTRASIQRNGSGDNWERGAFGSHPEETKTVAVTAPATAAAAQWAGYGTALKPAYEPVIVARLPLDGTVANNAQTHGTGALAIDACRINGLTGQRPNATMNAWGQERFLCDSCASHAAKNAKQKTPATRDTIAAGNAGRTLSARDLKRLADISKTDIGCCAGLFQVEQDQSQSESSNLSTGAFGNLSMDRSQADTKYTTSTETSPTTESGICNSCGREITGRITSSNTQVMPSARRNTQDARESAAQPGRWPSNLIHDGSDEVLRLFPETAKSTGGQASFPKGYGEFGGGSRAIEKRDPGYGDTGSAARFFYTAKASTSERGAGLENGNPHPTVKPLALTEYLARLILPPELDEPRRLFVPFAGSGSEIIGARRAGWDIVEGVELEAAHVDIARARVAHWEVAS